MTNATSKILLCKMKDQETFITLNTLSNFRIIQISRWSNRPWTKLIISTQNLLALKANNRTWEFLFIWFRAINTRTSKSFNQQGFLRKVSEYKWMAGNSNCRYLKEESNLSTYHPRAKKGWTSPTSKICMHRSTKIMKIFRRDNKSQKFCTRIRPPSRLFRQAINKWTKTLR